MKMTSLSLVAVLALAGVALAQAAAPSELNRKNEWTMKKMDQAKAKEWLAAWDKQLDQEAKGYRQCDKAVGEDIAWLMTPIMEGFYYGHLATQDAKWIDHFVDWTDSLLKRAVKEPDGYVGWPGKDPHGTEVDKLSALFGDSMLGDAMVFRPIVLMSGAIRKDPALKAKYGAKAEDYLKLAEQIYEKWNTRGGWRETKNGGLISVVGYYGIGEDGKWTLSDEARKDPNLAFSHPNNKANHVARWWLALYDVTGKDVYKQNAEKWFRLLKSRLKQKQDGTYTIWNYWEPAGPWDYKPDGKTPKHWVGVHPKGGYYEIDTTGIVDAYEHGLVFTKADIDNLIKTGIAEKRFWTAFVPYSPEIQAKFEESHQPAGWGGLAATPRYLWLQGQIAAPAAK